MPDIEPSNEPPEPERFDVSNTETLQVEPTEPRRNTAARVRIGVMVAALALATGAVGFAIGQAAAPSEADTATGAAPDDPPSQTTDDVDAPVATEPPRPADTDVVVTAATGETIAEDVAARDAPAGMSMGGGGGGGQYSPNAYPEDARELLAERTTADGVTIRAHIIRYEPGMYMPYVIEGWTPAGWCYPSGDLRVSVTAPTSANIAWAPFYDEPKDGLAVATFSTGYVESAPMFGVVAQVGADASSVTLTTASGATDTATPTNGVALLIVPGEIQSDFTVTVDRAGQAESTSVTDLIQPWVSSEYRAACEPPPPALPDPGEQPADAEAARAAIDEAWHGAHFREGDPEVRRSFIDDDTGVAEAWEALQSGQYAEAAATSTTTMHELVFTSPTEAWFRYDIETSITNFYDRYGMAKLSADGIWQITRQTICQDIALAPGFGCSPSVETLLPPSAANDPRYSTMPIEG